MTGTSLLDDLGFVLIRDVLSETECASVAGAVAQVGRRAGSRNLLDLGPCRELARAVGARNDVRPLLPAGAVTIQCTLFDKSAAVNWLVSWHQDLSVPVRSWVPHDGCMGWSQKQGVLYVQPPVRVLEGLVALRVHLDDSGFDGGPLRIVPRSHQLGRLPARAAELLRNERGVVECLARRGDVLAMRPLVLHASSKAKRPTRRRVLHFVFGPPEPPCGLVWHRAV